MGSETPVQPDTPHSGGDLSRMQAWPETPVTSGRILRLPGDSGHPPVVLRRGIQYRATPWPDDRKNQGAGYSGLQAGDSGQEIPAIRKLDPFLHFLVNDARGRKMSIILQHLASC